MEVFCESAASSGFGHSPQLPADLVTFTEEILNEKLDFLCSAISVKKLHYIYLLGIRNALFDMHLFVTK